METAVSVSEQSSEQLAVQRCRRRNYRMEDFWRVPEVVPFVDEL